MSWYTVQDEQVTIRIQAVPRASVDRIDGVRGDALKVRVKAPPVEGRANDRLIRFLSKQWQIPRCSIELLSGGSSRCKCIRITRPPESLLPALAGLEES
jgi:uncharacterized protein (TIGR00251 family)